MAGNFSLAHNNTILFRKIYWKFIDLIYPPRCVQCRKIGKTLCDNCQNQIKYLDENICQICRNINDGRSICIKCKKTFSHLDGVRSLAVYQGIFQKIIVSIKYGRNKAILINTIPMLNNLLFKQNWPIDIVTSVPISNARRKERGYNQAGWIARLLCSNNGLSYSPNALSKIKDTKSQVGLTTDERFLNVKDVFQGENLIVQSKNILLVDDVITSGATLESAAGALKKAGADKVYGLTLARTGVS